MKTILSIQELSEFDIKPSQATEEWRGMVETEIADKWRDRSGWVRVGCPACRSQSYRPAFEKMGLAYLECERCGSLFAPLRPSEDAIWHWHRESEPACYWREQLLPASELVRQEKVIRPRADWILDGMAEYIPSAGRIIDFSTHGRSLLDILSSEAVGVSEFVAAGMTADLDGGATPRIVVKPTMLAQMPTLGKADVVIAVDIFDRVVDLKRLIAAFESVLGNSGVVFATVPVASGFEIQTLWDKSPTVMPPFKLNLPTVDGLLELFSAQNWEVMELSTTGMFDVEMVIRTMAAFPEYPWPRAIKCLVHHDDPVGRAVFVEFLQSRRLTSFARVAARRRT